MLAAINGYCCGYVRYSCQYFLCGVSEKWLSLLITRQGSDQLNDYERGQGISYLFSKSLITLLW